MQRYLEQRTANQSSTTKAADLARHLLARQHLGKTVIVCDRPIITISIVRKYWLKLARNLQRERASTLNTERILQLTHDITRMQHMLFVARPYREVPRGDVFFMTSDQLDLLPSRCLTLYLLDQPDDVQLRTALDQLAHRSLVVSYSTQSSTLMGLQPKSSLDALIPTAWQETTSLLRNHGIDIDSEQHRSHLRTFDELLDAALNNGRQFLKITDDFLELLRLDQPVQLSNSDQRRYELLETLNRRVAALTPGVFSSQFTDVLSDEEELALHDIATEDWAFALAFS